MTILLTALILGLMGSFHCAGMCGPIALTLPAGNRSAWEKIKSNLLWSLGRIITYSIMGALFGLIGTGFRMAGFQKGVTILMGLTMVLYVLAPSLFPGFSSGRIARWFRPVRMGIQKLFQGKTSAGLFLIGLLNGLLPCGLVYMAVAGAIGTADVRYSAAYMALFGLGTVPLLLVVSLLGNVLGLALRERIGKLVPAAIILVGLLFILRGLSLGIPFVSPPDEKLSPAKQVRMESSGMKKAVDNACCHTDSLLKISGDSSRTIPAKP